MTGPGRADRPGQGDSVRRDIPYRLLTAAIAIMRAGRRDWGRAMLAELDYVRSPGDRARFALSAARVALFPPRASPSWRMVPAGLAVRAVVAVATIHALAPAVGPVPLVLMAVPAAGAWGTLTIPALAGRHGSGVLAAQGAVAAGVTGCLALALLTMQHYPQVMSTGGGPGWIIGVVFDVVSAGYLGLALLLPRWSSGTGRSSGYALAAALVVAVSAAYYVAHPSLTGLWTGTAPGEYLLAGLAVPAATALAAWRGGRFGDGLQAAAWAAMLGALITSIMIIAATSRVAPSAAGSQQIIAEARAHGVASASVWLSGDNLGSAISVLISAAVIFLAAGVAGAAAGCALRAVSLNWRTSARGTGRS
jgi:hypothetical protein